MANAIKTGFRDGREQGFHLSSGMTYASSARQVAYDLATWVGALSRYASR